MRRLRTLLVLGSLSSCLFQVELEGTTCDPTQPAPCGDDTGLSCRNNTCQRGGSGGGSAGGRVDAGNSDAGRSDGGNVGGGAAGGSAVLGPPVLTWVVSMPVRDGGEGLGQSVSIDSAGGIIVAGAPGGSGNGAALLITRTDGGWKTAELANTVQNPSSNSLRFGAFVKAAAGGRVVAVGYPHPGGTQMGVRVFRGAGLAMAEDLAGANEGFGSAFDLTSSGNMLVVGAAESSTYGPGGNGLVRTYRFNGANSFLVNQDNPQSPDAGVRDHLVPPERPLATRFGSGIALSNGGTALWVGSYALPGDAGTATGGVLRFEGLVGNWSTVSRQLRFRRRATGSYPENCGDSTGLAVSEAGDVALVGCPGEEGAPGVQSAGSVRLLRFDGGTVASEAIVRPATNWDSFGSFARVALTRSGSIGVIGQPGRNTVWLLDTADAGLVDLDLGLTLPSRLTTASGAGTSVAISDDGRTIVVGAPALAAVCSGGPSVFTDAQCVTAGAPSGGVLIFERSAE